MFPILSRLPSKKGALNLWSSLYHPGCKPVSFGQNKVSFIFCGSFSTGKKKRKPQRKEVQKGHFFEIKELKEHGGKVFATDLSLRPKAILFPALDCIAIEDSTPKKLPHCLDKKTSLVAISFKQYGFQMLESWTTPYLEQRSGKSPTPHLEPNLVHLSIVEGFVLSMLRGLLTKSLAAALPAPLRPRALAAFADAESFRESLSISNRLSGYLYLVDRDGFVRWRASGKASEEELRLLLKAVDDLAAEENSSLQQQHSSKRRRGQNS